LSGLIVAFILLITIFVVLVLGVAVSYLAATAIFSAMSHHTDSRPAGVPLQPVAAAGGD
jgi:hypothetical protein